MFGELQKTGDKMVMDTTIKKSTFSQNRVIYFSLGLDIRNANVSISEATEIIEAMQTDPQFAYDFLVQKEGVVVKDEKILARSIAKVQKMGRLFSNKKKKKEEKMKNKGENSISMNEILNHIIKNISKYTTAITLQNICDEFNEEMKRSVQLGRMSSVLAGLTRKGLLTRISKGIYQPIEDLVQQSQNLKQEEEAEDESGHEYDESKFSPERKLVVNFIKENNTTGELVFTLSELRRAYPEACPKKLAKAVQNMKFNNPNMVGTGVLGEYKIKAPVEKPSVAPVAPKQIVEEKQKDIDDFIVDAVKLVRRLGFEKAKVLLEKANKILQEI